MREMHERLKRFCNKWEWLILLLGIIVLFRIPSLFEPHHYGDEEIYFVMGRAWREGVSLYSGAFDHKPPLIYILAGLTESVFLFRFVLMLWMMVHTWLFWLLAEWFWGKKKQFFIFLSTLIFVIVTTLPFLEGQIANGELFMMMPITAAFVILLTSKKRTMRKCLFAGLVAGIGLLFKIPVIFDFVALILLLFPFSKENFKKSIGSIFSWKLVVLVVGFLIPAVASFAYYYFSGIGQEYLQGAFLVNFGYTSSYATSSYDFNPFASGLFIRGMVLVAYTVVLYSFRKKMKDQVVLAHLWFAWSFFGALLSARPYPHYLLQPAVPFALLIPLIFMMDKVIEWVMFGGALAAGIVANQQIKFWGYPTISYYKNFIDASFGKISDEEYISSFSNSKMNFELTEYLSGRMSEDGGLYVWGTDSSLYNLTDTLPAGGKYIVSFHVRDFQAYDEVMSKLRENEPEYVVVLPDPIPFEKLFNWLDTYYVETTDIQGTVVYRRF